MGDTWGGSWGSSWGLSWTRGEVTPPPVVTGGSGGFGAYSSDPDVYSTEWKKRYDQQQAWKKHFERQHDRILRRSSELPRKKDQKAVQKAARDITEAVKQIAERNPDYYSEALNGALGAAAEAKSAAEIVRLSKIAAELALAEVLAAIIDPPRYEMTDWDRAAILLLS